MPKFTQGQTLNYLPQCGFGRKLGGADFEESVCKRQWPHATPGSELGGNQKLFALNKMNAIGLILGGRTIFTGTFPLQLGKEQYIMVKTWKTVDRRLSVGCCPPFIWSIFSTTTCFLHKIPGLQIGFFFLILKWFHTLSLQDKLTIKPRNLQFGCMEPGTHCFWLRLPGFGIYISVWLFASSCSFSYSYICMWKLLCVFCWYPAP